MIGPLKTEETSAAIEFWIRRVQDRGQTARKFEVDKLELNLQTNERGLYECRGRIQGDYPIYLPDEDVYSE